VYEPCPIPDRRVVTNGLFLDTQESLDLALLGGRIFICWNVLATVCDIFTCSGNIAKIFPYYEVFNVSVECTKV